MAKTIKVRIPAQTIEVDIDKWSDEYGVDRDKVREDVKDYFRGYFQQIIEELDMK